jgi:hypothetical protein
MHSCINSNVGTFHSGKTPSETYFSRVCLHDTYANLPEDITPKTRIRYALFFQHQRLFLNVLDYILGISEICIISAVETSKALGLLNFNKEFLNPNASKMLQELMVDTRQSAADFKINDLVNFILRLADLFHCSRLKRGFLFNVIFSWLDFLKVKLTKNFI